jgi:hypothetical protein
VLKIAARIVHILIFAWVLEARKEANPGKTNRSVSYSTKRINWGNDTMIKIASTDPAVRVLTERFHPGPSWTLPFSEEARHTLNCIA